MHKLVILIEGLSEDNAFDELWPQFLHLAEHMPGLLREAACHVEHNLYGSSQPLLIHELYFESVEAIQAAMRSPEGRVAGELLQRMTNGQMSLLIAAHLEDDPENIRKHWVEPYPREEKGA